MVRNGEPSAKKRKSVKVCPSEVSNMTKVVILRLFYLLYLFYLPPQSLHTTGYSPPYRNYRILLFSSLQERAIFSTMEYMESAPDSDGPVKSWIANQSEGKVGDFVDNKMVLGDVVTEVLSAATGGVLATVHCATESTAIASSRSAAQSWGKSGNGFQRSKMLYR
eukprot:sb/3472576/